MTLRRKTVLSALCLWAALGPLASSTNAGAESPVPPPTHVDEFGPLRAPEGFQLISWGAWIAPAQFPVIAVEPCGAPEDSSFACYVVQPGDWLWRIARAAAPQIAPGHHCALTDPHEVALRANWLYHVNAATIGPDPARITPGMVLKVGETAGFLLGELHPCLR